MASKAVYARLDQELHENVKAHSEVTGQSLSSTIKELVRRGLAQLSSQGLSEALETELVSIRERLSELGARLASSEGEKKALEGQLEVYKTRASLALTAQKHAQTLEQQASIQAHQIDQLRNYLSAFVAVCKACQTHLRLYDIGQRRCARCSNWGFDWLPSYRPPPTPWETLRDGAAVVGAASLVVALLNASNAGQQNH